MVREQTTTLPPARLDVNTQIHFIRHLLHVVCLLTPHSISCYLFYDSSRSQGVGITRPPVPDANVGESRFPAKWIGSPFCD